MIDENNKNTKEQKTQLSIENNVDKFYVEYNTLCSKQKYTENDIEIHFIDYNRLSSHLQKIKDYLENKPDEIKQLIDTFWSILKSDIENVNTFYTQKESAFLKKFQKYKFNNFTSSTNMDDKQVLCVFSKLLHERCPEEYEIFTQKNEIPSCCIDNIKKDDKILTEKFNAFFNLCNDLNMLRKYVVLNYLTIFKIIDTFDKITLKDSLNKFVPSLISEKFYSSLALAQLLVRTECVTASLMAQHERSPPNKNNYLCNICFDLLSEPVVISCGHRFCIECLELINDVRTINNAIDTNNNWSYCNVCRKQQNLNPSLYQVDGVLKHFLKSHFGEIRKNQKIKTDDSITKKEPSIDISYSDCRIPDTTVLSFQLVTSGKNQKVFQSEYYPQKTSYRRGYKRNQRKSIKQQFQYNVQGILTRSTSNKQEAYAYSQLDMKPASCHQCKSNKIPIHLLFCSSGKKKKGQRCCHKKFCDLCLQRYTSAEQVIMKMGEQRKFKAGLIDTFIWICPACRNICTCAGCKRKRTSQETGIKDSRSSYFKMMTSKYPKKIKMNDNSYLPNLPYQNENYIMPLSNNGKENYINPKSQSVISEDNKNFLNTINNEDSTINFMPINEANEKIKDTEINEIVKKDMGEAILSNSLGEDNSYLVNGVLQKK